jgi:formyl-CoA transferase
MSPSAAGPALDGLRVIDLTHFEAGTSATQALAWMGADVIKVEPPGRGEQGRAASAEIPGKDSYYFLMLNCNKRSVELNLRTDAGKEILFKLVQTADVFVENFGPGTIERLGFGYDELIARNPRLVYAQVKGYGRGSPYEHYLSFDSVGQAVGGAVSITGVPGEPPFRCGPTLGDTGTGLHLVVGILGALLQRERTGAGQRIEVSMQESVINYCRVAYAWQMRDGSPAQRFGNGFAMPTAPAGVYECAGGGPNDYCSVYSSRASDEQWQRLLDVIGRPDLSDDPRFASVDERAKYPDEINEIIGEWTVKLPKLEVMRRLGEAGVPAGAVFDTLELSEDPYLREKGMFVTIEHAERGSVDVPGWPVQMSASHVPVLPPPLLGQHTAEVLAELGITAPEGALERMR